MSRKTLKEALKEAREAKAKERKEASFTLASERKIKRFTSNKVLSR